MVVGGCVVVQQVVVSSLSTIDEWVSDETLPGLSMTFGLRWDFRIPWVYLCAITRSSCWRMHLPRWASGGNICHSLGPLMALVAGVAPREEAGQLSSIGASTDRDGWADRLLRTCRGCGGSSQI